MRDKNRYAAIGFVVAKFVYPVMKRQAKRAARRKARGAVTSTAGAVQRHPARTSVVVGATIGAVGWLLMRGHGDAGSVDVTIDDA